MGETFSARHVRKTALTWLIVVVVMLAGGATFSAIELDTEKASIRAHLDEMAALEDSIQNNATFADVREVIAWMEEHGDCSEPELDNFDWDFASATFFAVTIMTSIGYGSFACATPAGHAFTIIFGVVTLPLFGCAPAAAATAADDPDEV